MCSQKQQQKSKEEEKCTQILLDNEKEPNQQKSNPWPRSINYSHLMSRRLAGGF